MSKLHDDLDAVDKALSFETMALVRRGMLHRYGFGVDAVRDLWDWVSEFTSQAADDQVAMCLPVSELLKVDDADCPPAAADLARMIGIMAKVGCAEAVHFTD